MITHPSPPICLKRLYAEIWMTTVEFDYGLGLNQFLEPGFCFEKRLQSLHYP
jgi:hypothetical protein